MPGPPIRIVATTAPEALIPSQNHSLATITFGSHVVIRFNGGNIWRSSEVIDDIGTVPEDIDLVRNKVNGEIARIVALHLAKICDTINQNIR